MARRVGRGCGVLRTLALWNLAKSVGGTAKTMLIHVFGHPQGFAFPSIFGLLYAATFGHIALLAHARLRGSLAIALAVVSLLILLISACARIVLGAHWLSDLWVAFLIGLFWIELLLPASGGET